MITRPFGNSGLGSNLLSMVGALYACERSGRHLIVDWTGMSELRDKQANYFLLGFEPIRSWRGVEILYASDPDVPTPASEADVLNPVAHQYADLLEGRLTARFVRLEAFHYDRVFQASPLAPAQVFDYTRAYYEQLTPAPAVRQTMARVESRFAERGVIGINIRTGNGQFVAGQPYHRRVNTEIFDRADFVTNVRRACADCVAALPRRLRNDAAIYVVTDCLSMQERLLQLPESFALRTTFPPEGIGHQWEFADETGADRACLSETVADLLLMAKCGGLVFNFTEYNRYAMYMTRYFNGNARRIEEYFRSPLERLGRRILRRLRRRAPG